MKKVLIALGAFATIAAAQIATANEASACNVQVGHYNSCREASRRDWDRGLYGHGGSADPRGYNGGGRYAARPAFAHPPVRRPHYGHGHGHGPMVGHGPVPRPAPQVPPQVTLVYDACAPGFSPTPRGTCARYVPPTPVVRY
jgi:hypothetical protein